MSLIASFHLVDARDLVRLQRAARSETERGIAKRLVRRASAEHTFSAALSRYGREIPTDYPWPGECLLYLLTYLEDKGVPLLQSEHDEQTVPVFADLGVSVIPLTPRHQQYLAQLDPLRLDEDEVTQYFAENYGMGETGGEAAKDGLVVLSQQIASLRADDVLLLVLG